MNVIKKHKTWLSHVRAVILLLVFAHAGILCQAQAAFNAAEGLFDKNNQKTLGLEILPVTQTVIYEARQGGRTFSHTPNIVVFRDSLYLMWSSGIKDEDMAGQQVMYSKSRDGVSWTEPKVLFSPEMVSDNPEASLMSAGWVVLDDELMAFTTASLGKKFFDMDLTAIWAGSSTDGETWSKPRRISEGLFLEAPKRTKDGWILLGQGREKRPLFLYAEEKHPPWNWKKAPVTGDPKRGDWPEPASYQRPDGTLVATIRAHRSLGFILYAAESADGGRTWQAGPTNFPDAVARVAAGNLPDGSCYLIGNPNPVLRGRNVMAISLSKDGRLFDRAYALLTDPPPLKFEGRAKYAGWQYPSALVWMGNLYVAYSVGKEDIRVLHFPCSSLIIK